MNSSSRVARLASGLALCGLLAAFAAPAAQSQSSDAASKWQKFDVDPIVFAQVYGMGITTVVKPSDSQLKDLEDYARRLPDAGTRDSTLSVVERCRAASETCILRGG